MTPIICTDVQRDNGSPLYTVKIYDIDVPSNFHSYDCIFFKQGRDLNVLLEQAQQEIFKELHTVDGNAVIVQTPPLPSDLDEAAEDSWALYEYRESPKGLYSTCYVDAFKAGADFGAKNMLAKLKENCVIINKDLYEIAMEGKFIEGKEEGIKWMAGQGVTIDGKVIMDFSEPADIINRRLIAKLGDSLLEIEPGDVVVQIRKKQ